MTSEEKTVISASRRTDIPAFYMPWFMQQMKREFFEVINPYNRRVSIVPATPDRVHSFVFWSKNFGPFLDGCFGEELRKRGYNLFFNFTVNSDSEVLEPHVPPLQDRLEQLREICERFGPRAVNWRFDPICFYRNGTGDEKDNLGEFGRIAAEASRCGVGRCVTSFMDDYAKIRKRVSAMSGFSFVYPVVEKQTRIVLEMAGILKQEGLSLFLCCEKELLERLPPASGVKASACIPSDLLLELYGGRLSLKKDCGQRVKAGCGCRVSVDIGSYALHSCRHRCLFCYANPATG